MTPPIIGGLLGVGDTAKSYDAVVIGAGVSGLSAAHGLRQRGMDVLVLEGRSRIGGRVLSIELDAGAGIDLGPAWVWPDYQPRVRELIQHHDLEVLNQYEDGDLLFEDAGGRISRAKYPRRYSDAVRLRGGMRRLIQTLQDRVSDVDIRLGQEVVALSFVNDGITIAISGQRPVSAGSVVLAVPPVLCLRWIISPVLPPELQTAIKQCPTWMAAHAKFVACYDEPFWRQQGLSGAVVSHRGPLFEVADHSDPERKSHALFGFLGIPAAERQQMQKAELEPLLLQHFARLFGEQAMAATQTWLMDWADDTMTASESDWVAAGNHPPYGEAPLTRAWFDQRLAFCAAETDPRFGGLIEGALTAGARAAQQVMPF